MDRLDTLILVAFFGTVVGLGSTMLFQQWKLIDLERAYASCHYQLNVGRPLGLRKKF